MTAWVKGRPAQPDAALAAAADLLGRARAPLVAGLCADAAAIGAAYRLARDLGATVDPAAGPGLYADLAALAAAGAMTTSPAEAAGRADGLLAVGHRPWADPLLAGLAAGTPSRGRAAGSARAVLALGGTPGGTGQATLYPAPDGLPAALGLLRGLAAGRIAGDHALSDLAARLRGALFAVVAYDPAELGPLGTEMLTGLVKDLNTATRAFALPLGVSHQGRAVAQVAAWTTGQGPRVGFGRGRAEHDPWRCDAARQTAAGEADAALWLAALPAPRPDWTRTVPTVALLGEAAGDEAEVVIRVAVPGRERGGALWHPGRAAIAWHPATAPAGAPDAEDILAGLRARLAPTEHPASC
ncbi:formyltransferase [Methylobacterium oryzihabitans]|uniref:Formyltransferase n=1 Tax=Methylobacterium oryzihabitans TaxID=2499852 RepID=A0A437P6D0_9HYPH|nr:formyltransferase [Methylobacterium oryzihabitans]RVU17826.1 formyltransferase [Methylobacterium oryzihabitans]